MAFRVIGQNSVITAQIGTVQNGTASTYATAIPITARAKTVSVDITMATADMSTLGDTEEITQVTRRSKKIQLDVLVGNGGPVFDGVEGKMMKVSVKSDSTVSAATVHEGVVTGYKLDFPDGPTMETITMTCGANGTSLTP